MIYDLTSNRPPRPEERARRAREAVAPCSPAGGRAAPARRGPLPPAGRRSREKWHTAE
ncbi:hypothetical protein GCM10010466_24410 [Planomonospora alba]|uniref:Uncharacterized protein n=1 Tax=Planomonospora alba TaxID=161354 RepID=A0ABP6N348_9ACTN